MTIWWLIVILGSICAAGIGFIFIIVKISSRPKSNFGNLDESAAIGAEKDVEHLFNEDFREELRNRGRLHFEKIIGENAMFLQQDLRLTTSELNEYMKSEVTRSLKEEFAKYEQSISDAKQLAIESIEKTNQAIQEERNSLSSKVQKEVNDTKDVLIENFTNNMTEIINHYLIAAIGNQIDLSDQLEFIVSDLESNKEAIIEDLKSGS